MSLSLGKESSEGDDGMDDKKKPAGRTLVPPNKVTVPLPSVASKKPPPDKSTSRPPLPAAAPITSKATLIKLVSDTSGPIIVSSTPTGVPAGDYIAGGKSSRDTFKKYDGMNIGKNASQSGTPVLSVGSVLFRRIPTPKSPSQRAVTSMPYVGAAGSAPYQTMEAKSVLHPTAPEFVPKASTIQNSRSAKFPTAPERRPMQDSQQPWTGYADPATYRQSTAGGPGVVRGGAPRIQGYDGVLVKNISEDTKESDILGIFSQAGDIVALWFPKDDKGQSKGFASIRYKTLEGAKAALDKFNNTFVEGRSITVKVDTDSPVYVALNQSTPIMPSSGPVVRIRITNIHPRTLYYTIDNLMERYGALPGRMKLYPDPSGVGTQVAVVEFPSEFEAHQAMQGLRTIPIDTYFVTARAMSLNE